MREVGYNNEIFESMKGQTIVHIQGKVGDEEMIFTMKDGSQYVLFYEHDCCASCTIEDICGDLQDLINHPLLVAEVSGSDEPLSNENYGGSFTWSFYKLDTIKGGVTIRWYGESNGYYSEEVTCIKRENKNE